MTNERETEIKRKEERAEEHQRRATAVEAAEETIIIREEVAEGKRQEKEEKAEARRRQEAEHADKRWQLCEEKADARQDAQDKVTAKMRLFEEQARTDERATRAQLAINTNAIQQEMLQALQGVPGIVQHILMIIIQQRKSVV